VVTRAVLGTGSVIGSGAEVRDSVLLPGAEIGEGAKVSGSVIGPGARVGAGSDIRPVSVLGALVEVGPGAVVDGERVPG
jgi:NDP-sugar pyrophosphorylase family protein